MLFELTNFFKVEFIRKEKGGLLLLVLIFRAKENYMTVFEIEAISQKKTRLAP